MKRTIKLIVLLLASLSTTAQTKAIFLGELPSLFLSPGVSLYLISPQPIRYVDISDERMVGDLPEDNILRLKFPGAADSGGARASTEQGTVVTVVGQDFMAQYVVYPQVGDESLSVVSEEILPEVMRPLELSGFSLSRAQLKNFALRVSQQKRSCRKVKSRQAGMNAWLNNIFTAGDYIFVDISFHNQTKLRYDIDAVRFHLKDKRINRATNVQDVELKPEYVLYNKSCFQKSYRNVYVFRKFSFPGNKQFCVELSEKQLSGRSIELAINYGDLLHADTL